MGVKRGTYQTKKQMLQKQCADRGIKFAVRWGTRELQAALDGKRPSAVVKKKNTNRPAKPAMCMPAFCTCGKAIDPGEVVKHEQRRDPGIRTKSPSHHFDGVIFCRNTCECGQNLVVRVPIRARNIKCECKRPAQIWDSDGKGTCVLHAEK